MKKKIITAIMIFTISLSAISFSWLDVKAMTQSRFESNVSIFYEGLEIGKYNSNAFTTSGSEYLNTTEFDVVGPSGTFKTAVVINIGFYEKATGRLAISFGGNMSPYTFLQIDGEGVGAYTYNQANKALRVDFDECMNIRIVLMTTTQQSTPTCNISSIEVYEYNEDVYKDYQIPQESITAYKFPLIGFNNSRISYEYGDLYPSIQLYAGELSQVVTYTLRTGLRFYFYCEEELTSNSYTVYTDSGTSTTVNLVKVNNYNFSNGYLYGMRFSKADNTESKFHLMWNSNLKIIPLYFGAVSNMSDNMAAVVGEGYTVQDIYDTQRSIIDWLGTIYYLLLEDDEAVIDPSIEDQSQAWNDLIDQEDQVVSDFNSDLDDFSQNVDLNDYDFISGLQNTSSYFQLLLDDVFNKSAQIRAMWVIPVICVVILALLGSR